MAERSHGCNGETLLTFCTRKKRLQRNMTKDYHLSVFKRISACSVRACSHEVNYLGVVIAPEQALPRVHMIICCPGAMLPWVNFIASGQVYRHLMAGIDLNSFSVDTNCYRKYRK